MEDFFTLSTVPGYAELVPCAQGALTWALNPQYAYYGNCQSQVAPSIYASCLCLTAYQEVTKVMDMYHNGCSTVTVWGADSVLNNFCSVELNELAPVNAGSTTVPSFSPNRATTNTLTPTAGSGITSEIASVTSVADPTNFSGATSPTSVSQSSSSSSGNLPLVAIIVIAILGFAIIFTLVVCCCCWDKIRQRLRNRKESDNRSHAGYNFHYQQTVSGSHLHALSRVSHPSISSGYRPVSDWPHASDAGPYSDITLRPGDSASNVGMR